MDIEKYRIEINQIDLDLLKLLNRRAELAYEIGQQKIKNGLPVYVPEREQSVFSRLVEKNTGPIDDEGIKNIFERIMEVCRQIQ